MTCHFFRRFRDLPSTACNPALCDHHYREAETEFMVEAPPLSHFSIFYLKACRLRGNTFDPTRNRNLRIQTQETVNKLEYRVVKH